MAALFASARGGNEGSRTSALCRAYLAGCDYEEVDLVSLLDLRPLVVA